MKTFERFKDTATIVKKLLIFKHKIKNRNLYTEVQ